MYYLRSVRLYLQLFVGGLMYYLRSGSSLFVCRRTHVLFTFGSSYLQLFVGGLMYYLRYLQVRLWFVFTSSCL